MLKQTITRYFRTIAAGKKSSGYLKLIILFGLIGLGCTTRVSEWVLLNILPVNYSLRYIHGNVISDFQKKQNEYLKESLTSANIRFTDVMKPGTPKPYYALYYKNRFFAEYDTPDGLKDLSTSPLRKKIAAELMDGKLCVMLYLKTDDKPKDEKGLMALRNTVGSSPFKDIITVCELSRNSVEEVHFISFLLNVEDDLKTIGEPMLFGIFGRFKALEPLVGKGISEENIGLMIDYLTAECSCLIKDDLPGTDILFAGKWENPRPARLNRILDENPRLSKK